MHDAIIIGGSYAGLAAALQLARARRDILIIDSGQRRNRFAHAAHGFLGQDGQSPAAIAERGRADVLAYGTVSMRNALVTEVAGASGDFRVVAAGEEHRAKRLVIATGVVDQLPEVPGLRERWGSKVFHCPYCHGYELDRGRLAILATSDVAAHHALLVSEWAGPGKARLFVNDAFEPTAEQLAQLAAREIAVERRRVTRIAGDADVVEVHVQNGEPATFEGVFLHTRTLAHPVFAEQLGCELETGPHGSYYKTDAMTKQTTVAGVFACGDVAQPTASISFAVADGMRAGVFAHQSLVFAPA
jgi:thioredoxin reductase